MKIMAPTLLKIVPNPEKFLLNKALLGNFLNNVYPFINDNERLKYVMFEPTKDLDFVISEGGEPLITIEQKAPAATEDPALKKTSGEKLDAPHSVDASLVGLFSQKPVARLKLQKKFGSMKMLFAKLGKGEDYLSNLDLVHNILYTNKWLNLTTSE